jgi:hypothetical protein
MKYLIWLTSLMLSTCAFSYAAELRNIEQLQWHNRLLILWSTAPDHDLNQLLNTYESEIIDRQLILLVLSKEGRVVSNFNGQLNVGLTDKLTAKFPKAKGKYYLIGKDGGIKAYGQQLDMTAILTKIDRMPMRRQEQLHTHQQ